MLHWHHIIPKHAGGTDDSSNMKQITIEDHAEEHKILYEKYGKLEDSLAYRGLLGLISKKDILKELCSRRGKDNPNFGKCGPLHPGFGKKRPDHSEKMKIVMKGKKKSKEHQDKLNVARRARAIINPVASKNWEVVLQNGEKLSINNMAKFCRENRLTKSCATTASKTGSFYRGCQFRKVQ